jgi:hypothetical protein
MRRQLAREEFACGLSCERANERSQRFVAMIAQRARLRSASWSSVAALSRSDHSAATPSRMKRFVRLVCDGQPEAIT